MIATDANLGGYLVDSEGKTLYLFTKDDPGVSNCKGQCVVIWPPFYTDKVVVPAGLDAADFATITREDGKKQTTFRGWSLYYFNKDMNAGDTKGQKVNDVWFVVPVK
jgi:predicted lipoprotein with Yx(FWY)xxD motif